MLFCSSQNKNGITRRLLKCFQESIESRIRKHVYLIDDVDLVLPCLGRIADLLYQGTDIFDRVIGGSI